MKKETFLFDAKVKRVVDGDTIDAVVDVGFHIKMELRFRLDGINAPEPIGHEKQDGINAKRWLDELMAAHDYRCVIKTVKTGNFGRWLATVWIESSDISVNEIMISKGYAVPYTP